MSTLTNESRIFLPALIEEIDNILEFTAGLTLEQFVTDKKTRYAFRQALTNASEAASNIQKMDDKAVEKFPGFPFKNLINTRNRIVHKYWDVNESVMYATATINIAALQKVVRVIFADDIKLMKNVVHKSVLDIISKIHGDDLTPQEVAMAIDEAMKIQHNVPTTNKKNEDPGNSI